MVNSRRKGKRGELELVRLFKNEGFQKVHRTAQYRGNTGQAGDIEGLDGLHVEVKRGKVIKYYEAMQQAVRDSEANGEGKIPVVASRKDDYLWLFTVRFDDLHRLYTPGRNLKQNGLSDSLNIQLVSVRAQRFSVDEAVADARWMVEREMKIDKDLGRSLQYQGSAITYVKSGIRLVTFDKQSFLTVYRAYLDSQ